MRTMIAPGMTFTNGSGRRLPCRSGKAVYWRAAIPLGHATTFAAARWRRAHRGPRRGTSSFRYRCRSRRSRYWVSETWRAPCLWCPLTASLAGGAGARPDHPITGHQIRKGSRTTLHLSQPRERVRAADGRTGSSRITASASERTVLNELHSWARGCGS
jgi:hypothetical protein